MGGWSAAGGRRWRPLAGLGRAERRWTDRRERGGIAGHGRVAVCCLVAALLAGEDEWDGDETGAVEWRMCGCD